MPIRPANSSSLSAKGDRLVIFPLFAMVFVVIISRAFQLHIGYGADPDAWRVANAARQIALNREYTVSRFPGYPVHEILCSFLWTGGPVALNGATTFVTAVAAVFLALSARELGCRYPILAGLTFSFVPVVYISSTTTIDYPWAAAFVLGSLYYALKARPVMAGILLGLAIGCRVTSGAMLLPLSFLFRETSTNSKLRGSAKFWLSTFCSSLFIFIPVLARYGLEFLRFYDSGGYPPLQHIVLTATINTWGETGMLAILAAMTFLLIRLSIRSSKSSRTVWNGEFRQFAVASILIIVLYSISYLRLPHEAGYLIPIIPFVLLSIWLIFCRKFIILFSLMMIMSPFIWLGRSGVSSGPAFWHFAERQKQLAYAQEVLVKTGGLRGGSVVVAYEWMPILSNLSGRTLNEPSVILTYSLDMQDFAKYDALGYDVYYLADTREGNERITGLDLDRVGAKLLATQ